MTLTYNWLFETLTNCQLETHTYTGQFETLNNWAVGDTYLKLASRRHLITGQLVTLSYYWLFETLTNCQLETLTYTALASWRHLFIAGQLETLTYTG